VNVSVSVTTSSTARALLQDGDWKVASATFCAALDELTPLLHRRAVDIEMPRLTVGADATALQRALVSQVVCAGKDPVG